MRGVRYSIRKYITSYDSFIFVDVTAMLKRLL